VSVDAGGQTLCVNEHNARMDAELMLALAPPELSHSTQQGDIAYTLARDVVAAHGPIADRDAALRHDAHNVAITPAREAPAGAGVIVGPVYRREPSGGFVIPTGMVLVRFADGDRAEHHRDEIAAAGFEIEQALSYAPQAAWVRARSGEIIDALRGLVALEQLPAVHNVEPQLLSEAARRD
jgi:hypothetical protein